MPMHFTIIASKKDPAGLNIVEQLRELKFSHPVHLVEEDIVHAENMQDTIKADIFIFASRHVSRTNIPSLTLHSIGNFGAAELGGKEHTLCSTVPSLLKEAFLYLKKHNTINFDVVMEATHHGPYCAKPSIFIEIGSTEKEWQNNECGRIIAETIAHITANKAIKMFPVLFGIGGPHINATFCKLMETTEYTFSYACAKYNVEHLDKAMIQQALALHPAQILVDWKGLGQEKERIKKLLDELGSEYLRSDTL